MPVHQTRPKKTARTIASKSTEGLSPAKRKAMAKLQASADKLIDEIDDVITQNAETLVDYRQRGGE